MPGFHNKIDIRGEVGNVCRTPLGAKGASNRNAKNGGGENQEGAMGGNHQPKARRRMVFRMGGRQHMPL